MVFYKNVFSLLSNGTQKIEPNQKSRGASWSLKKNLNAPRPSEHPPVRGKKIVWYAAADKIAN